MATLDDVVKKLSSFEIEKEKGDYFENVVVWFLKHSPIYKNLINPKKVYLFKDWDHKEKWRVESGVDIVAETISGELWAVQAKGYQPHNRLKIGDIRNWLNDSSRKIFHHRLLVSTTQSISPNAVNLIKGQEKPASYLLYNDLMDQELNWPDDVNKVLPKQKKFDPFPYQKPAISDVIKGFDTETKGQLIMACGTGKTLTSLWIDERLDTNLTICLFPSLLLLKKTMLEWNKHSRGEFLSLPICSDETVSKNDEPITQLENLGMPATTNINQIINFIKRKPKKVIFSTYQASEKLSLALLKSNVVPDLMIADEAHRTAGIESKNKERRKFSICLDDNIFPSKRKLFMTATPKLLSQVIKNKSQEFDSIDYSMDDRLLYGKEFHRLSFADAIEKYEALCDYEVHVLTIDNSKVKKLFENNYELEFKKKTYRAKNIASTISAELAYNNLNLRKFISFHNSIESATNFSNSFEDILNSANKQIKDFVFSKTLKGSQPTSYRARYLEKLGNLDKNDFGFVSNSRCLSEGIDVPSIDGIIISEPRQSKIDIVQIVGRALRLHPDKSKGLIIIPIIIDKDKNFEDQLLDSEFSHFMDTIRALRSHDERMEEIINNYVLNKARGDKSATLEPFIKFHNPHNIDEKIIDQLKLEYVTMWKDRWNLKYVELENFINKNKRLPFKRTGEERFLASWCQHQRFNKKKDILSEKQIQLLDNLKPYWWWEQTKTIEKYLPEIKKYLAENGHIAIPVSGNKAGFLNFIGRVRRIKNNGTEDPFGNYTLIQKSSDRINPKVMTLTKNEIENLENLHWTWTWDIREFTWELNYSLLKFYAQEEGTFKMPEDFVVPLPHNMKFKWKVRDSAAFKGYNLYYWLVMQRASYNKTFKPEFGKKYDNIPMMTDEKLKKLKKINFPFEADKPEIDELGRFISYSPKKDYSSLEVDNFNWSFV